MALQVLDISKNWFTGTTVREVNWDNIRAPLISWSQDIVDDMNQLRLDVFGASYSFDNDGLANMSNPLYDFTSKVSAVDWTFSGSVTFSANDINLFNGNDLILYKDAGVTVGLKLDGGALTTTNVIDVPTADTLTTGRILSAISNSADVSARSLVQITNDNTAATGAIPLSIQQDSTANGLFIDQNGNGVALNIDSEATTANGVNLSLDALTTGLGLFVLSDSSDASSRSLVRITNDNTAATGTIPLEVIQDAAQYAVFVDQNANAITLAIDSESTTANVVDISPATTTGNVIDVSDADFLTTGSILNLVSNSSDANTRNLVNIVNDNTAAASTVVLNVQQDGAEAAIKIDQNAEGRSLFIDTEAATTSVIDILCENITTGNAFRVSNADGLTTGSILNLVSNSSDTGERSLVQITNDNASATNAKTLSIQQDAPDNAIFIDHNADAAAIAIDSQATTAQVVSVDVSTLTAGHALNINTANSLTTGGIARLVSNSSNTSVRELFLVHNDNIAAVNATPLVVRQDAVGTAVRIEDPTGGQVLAIREDGALLLPDIDPPTANEANRNGIIKGWAFLRWDGANWMLDDSYNVSGHSDISSTVTGVTWDTNFNAIQYAVSLSVESASYTAYVSSRTTTALGITLTSAVSSGDVVHVMAIGDQ